MSMEVVAPRGIAACLDELELIISHRYYSELSLGLPVGDMLLLLDAGKLVEQRGRQRSETVVGNYRVEYVTTNADSKRRMRRFVRILAIEPEPPFAVVARLYKELGYVMAKFDVMWHGCVRDRPRVLRLAIGDVYELDVALEIGDKEYTLRRP